MTFANLSSLGLQNPYKTKYANFIGGKWVEPVDGQYFDNVTPLTGQTFCQIPAQMRKTLMRH